MKNYDRELEQLRIRIAQRQENQRVVGQLRQQEAHWRGEVSARQAQLKKEEQDVARLERVSLASIWASLRGTKEEDMDREQAEAWSARLKWQEADRQLTEVRGEIADREARIEADANAQTEYEALLREKEQVYREKDPILAAKLSELEQRQMELTHQWKELDEAVVAGRQALYQISAALGKLDTAEGLSAWDMFGGGLWTDMMKYESMEEAQSLMAQVQSDLRRYQAELADVAETARFELQIDGTLSVMDVFFDNIFADWAVRDRILRSTDQLHDVQARVSDMQRKLEQQLTCVEEELTKLRAEKDELVRTA